MQGERRVDPSTLQGVHKKRKDKEERLAAVRAGEYETSACKWGSGRPARFCSAPVAADPCVQRLLAWACMGLTMLGVI